MRICRWTRKDIHRAYHFAAGRTLSALSRSFDAFQYNRRREPDKLPFMQIGKQFFTLEEVIAGNDDASDWTGFTSFAALVERAHTLKSGKSRAVDNGIYLVDDI